MTDYKAVIAETPLELEIKVRALLREGWVLQGGIGFNSNTKMYLQAMVRH